jgi:hypothetical protein
VSAAIGYLEGGIGTAATVGSELSEGSRNEDGLFGPRVGDIMLCGGLGMVETGEADASGSFRSSV